MGFIGKIIFSIKYLVYLLTSRHKRGFGIHSPFAYQLITVAFQNRVKEADYSNIEVLRKKIIKWGEKIAINDPGAGSIYSRSPLRPVGQIVKYSSVNKKYGKLLFRIARHFQPSTIIELGTSVGISTAYLSAPNKKASVYTIEGNPGLANIAKSNFETLGLDNITLMEGNFDEQLPLALKNASHPLLVYFDGNHTKEATIRYFNYCMEHRKHDTVFIFDDIHWSKGMEEAWIEIKSHGSVKVTIDLFRVGFVFFKEGLQRQHYVIKF